MSAVHSDRRVIRDKVVEILGRIKKADGYNNDVQLVAKKFLSFADTTKLPALFVEFRLEVKDFGDQTEDLLRSKLGLSVTGLAESAADENDEGKLEDAIDELVSDIERALLDNKYELFDQTEAKDLLIFHVAPELVEGDATKATVGLVLVITYYHE